MWRHNGHRSPTFRSRDACCWNSLFPRHVDADLAYSRRTDCVASPTSSSQSFFFLFIYSSLSCVVHVFILTHRPGSCSDNILDLYRRSALFEYGPIYRSSWGLSWFSSVPSGKCLDSASIKPRPFLFEPFSVHSSSIILPFDVVFLSYWQRRLSFFLSFVFLSSLQL
jgi:hypothetical protein